MRSVLNSSLLVADGTGRDAAAGERPRPTGPRHAAPRRPLGWLRHGWSRLPLALRLILVLHTLLLLLTTVLFPNYRGPDEPLHVDLVAAAATGAATPWPAPGERTTDLGVDAGGFITNGRIAERWVLTAEAAPPRGQRPSFRAAGGGIPSTAANQLVQHPPLYYYLLAPVLALAPHWQDQPFDRLVALLRVVNALLLAPLPLLGFALARRVGLAEPVAVAAAAVPLAVPQLYHIGASVNNDNLLLPLLAGAFVAVAAVGRGDVRLRTAGVLGLLTGLCLLTKGLALFLPLLAGLAYLVAASRVGLRRSVLPAAAALATGLGIGGWWWVRNKLAYGTFQPDGTKLVQPELVPHTSFAETGGQWLGHFGTLMNRRFWLDPGSTLVQPVTDVAAAVAAALVVTGVGLSLATRSPRLRDALLLAVPLVCLAGIVGYGSWEAWEKVIRQSGMQGRYLYGALPGLAVLVVAGAGRLLGRRRAVLPLAVVLLAAAVQAVALRLTLPIYWLPESGSRPARLAGGIEAMLAWSPWPPVAVVAVAVGALATGAATVVVLARDARP